MNSAHSTTLLTGVHDASGAAMKALMKAILNDDSLKAIIAAQAGVLGGPPS
jgi:hypothetical protein